MFVKNHTKKLTGKNVKKEKPKEKVTGKTCHGKKITSVENTHTGKTKSCKNIQKYNKQGKMTENKSH